MTSAFRALFAAGLVWATPAAAQTPLPLSAAIDAAVAGNPALLATRAAARAADAEARVARAAWFPQVQFQEAWHRTSQPVAGFGTRLNARRFTVADFAVDRLNRPGTVDGFTRRVGIAQILFDGGRTRAGVAIATRQRESAAASVTTAEADLAVRVTEMYGRVASADAGRAAAASALAWVREDQSRADARRRAGTATDADVLSLAAHVAALTERELQAASDAIVARATLNQLMGAPVDRGFAVLLPSLPPAPADLRALTAEARGTRPELADAERGVAIARATHALARSAWLPVIAAEAGYAWDGLAFGTREGNWSVGAELRWSLSTGGADAARADAAHAGLEAATATRHAVAASIDVDVLTAREQVQVALARAAAGRAAAADARESQRIVRERYAAGLATVTDVLAASSAVLAAGAQETANQVGAVVAWARLERAIGRAPFVTR